MAEMSGRFARNSVFSMLAGLGTALGSFLSVVLVAQLLGPVEMGVIAYALWIVTLAVTLADVGITHTLARYLPEMTARGEELAALGLVSWLLRLCLVLAATGAVLFCWFGYDVAGEGSVSRASLWFLGGLLFTLQYVSAIGLATLRGLQRFDEAARLTVVSLALQLVAVSLGGLLYGTCGALAGYCAGSLLPIGVALRFAAAPARIDNALRARIVPFAFYAWSGALTLSFVWSRVEIFFLQRYRGPEAVAIFTVAFSFSNLAAQAPLLLTGGLLPHFSELYARHDIARMREAYAAATRVMAFLLFPVCLILAVILPAVIPLVYGPRFSAAVPVACVLVASSAIVANGAVGSHLIYAHERSDFIFRSGLFGAVLTVAAGFLVIPTYGMMGAALARATIHILMFTYGSWFIVRRLHCPMPIGALLRLLFVALLSALVAHLCIVTVRDPFLAVTLAVGSGTLVYVAAVRAFRALPTQDIAWLRAQTRRLPHHARIPMHGFLALLAPRHG